MCKDTNIFFFVLLLRMATLSRKRKRETIDQKPKKTSDEHKTSVLDDVSIPIKSRKGKFKFKNHRNKKFTMKKWNNFPSTLALQKRGIMKIMYAGAFKAEVCYLSQTPGFVVQEVFKTGYTNINSNKREVINKEHYWEVFYLHDRDCENNNDSFAQKNFNIKTEGVIVQTGINKFYPFKGPVLINKDGFILPSTDDFIKMFGSNVTRESPMAWGMPVSYSLFPMTGLTAQPVGIIRQVVVQWGTGDKNSFEKGHGYPTYVTELIYRGKMAGKGYIVPMEQVELGLDRPLTWLDKEEDETEQFD